MGLHVQYERHSSTYYYFYVVSDRCYRGEAEDKSGPSLKEIIQDFTRWGKLDWQTLTLPSCNA